MGIKPVRKFQRVLGKVPVMVIAEGNGIIERPSSTGIASSKNMGTVEPLVWARELLPAKLAPEPGLCSDA